MRWIVWETRRCLTRNCGPRGLTAACASGTRADGGCTELRGEQPQTNVNEMSGVRMEAGAAGQQARITSLGSGAGRSVLEREDVLRPDRNVLVIRESAVTHRCGFNGKDERGVLARQSDCGRASAIANARALVMRGIVGRGVRSRHGLSVIGR